MTRCSTPRNSSANGLITDKAHPEFDPSVSETEPCPETPSAVLQSDEAQDRLRDTCYALGLDYEHTLWVLRWHRSHPQVLTTIKAVGGTERDLITVAQCLHYFEEHRQLPASTILQTVTEALTGRNEPADGLPTLRTTDFPAHVPAQQQHSLQPLPSWIDSSALAC